MTFTHEITLDLSYNKLKTIHIKQYTKNCFLLRVSLTDRGEPFHADKNSQSCFFKMETPDKRYIFTDCTINDDGTIDVPIPEGACLAAGNGTAELVFIKSELAAKNNPQGASSNSLPANPAKESADRSSSSIDKKPDDSYAFATMNLNVNIIASSYSNDCITSSNQFDALDKALAEAKQTFKEVTEAAKASATQAKSYAVGGTGTRENEETDNARYYCTETQKNANTATAKATAASNSAASASQSAASASQSAASASGSALLSQSYAVGGTSLKRPNNQADTQDNAKYYYTNAKEFYEKTKQIHDSFSGALRPMGTVAFANLPALADAREGDMYNISDQFITNANFMEGANLTIPAGSNVYKTAGGKWDVLAGSLVAGVKGEAEKTYRKGNVNLTPTDVGALALTGGTLSGNLTPAGGVAYAGKNSYLSYPDDGTLVSTNSPTGYLRISLPVSWTNTMVKFTVSIYEYTTGESIDYHLSGYNYGGGPQWLNCTAVCVGKAGASHANLPVRFGHDGSKCAVTIGEASTVWHYPQVKVHDVVLGYSNYGFSSWHSGWGVAVNASALPTISTTISNTHVAYGGNAATATKATQDSDGNVIKDCYAVSKVIYGDSFDTFKTPGIYRVRGTSGMKNTPFETNASWSLIVAGKSSKNTNDGMTVIHQIAIPEESNNVYVRYYNGVWASWTQLLNTSGGTITGNLRLKGSGNYGNTLNFGDSDYVHISEPTDDNMEIKAKNINFVTTNGLTLNSKKILTINEIYPVGSIYMSVSSTNPSTLFGGTWVRWGNGRVPVGISESETEFSYSEKTGGAKTVALSVSNMPQHDHGSAGASFGFSCYALERAGMDNPKLFEARGSATVGGSGHIKRLKATANQEETGGSADTITMNTAHTHSKQGSGTAHNNLQPYITCYMWKRTA